MIEGDESIAQSNLVDIGDERGSSIWQRPKDMPFAPSRQR